MKTFFLFALILAFTGTLACTTAVFSGKSTADGRPMLWKHRDSDFYNNKVMFFHGRKFDYAGIVNSDDIEYKEIWGGYNTAGFAVMNSASYNLKPDSDTTSLKDMEGYIIRKALETCQSIDDFEQLLKNLPKPLGVEANFGVIDALGGAAYFETNNFSWVKFDINDPTVAPEGYLIRSNYSFSGIKNKGYGYVRYKTAANIIAQAYQKKAVTPEFLLQEASRCLKNVQINTNLEGEFVKLNQSTYYPLTDYIVREYSTSTIVVQGVKPNENPLFTTAYVIVGFQLTSVAVPFWIGATDELPLSITAPKGLNAELCENSLELKKKVFDLPFEGGENYINLYNIGNKNGTGYWQLIKPAEDEILKITRQKLQIWRENSFNAEEVKNHYRWIDQKIRELYQHL